MDEGALWARGTLSPSTGPPPLEGEASDPAQARRVTYASFPEVKAEIDDAKLRWPDDGTDPALFANTEYFIDLKPKNEWRSVFRQDKEGTGSRAMDREVEKIPRRALEFLTTHCRQHGGGAFIDVGGELAIKIFGTDLRLLEKKGEEIVDVMSKDSGSRGRRTLSCHRPAEPELHRESLNKPAGMALMSRTFKMPYKRGGQRECGQPGAGGRSEIRSSLALRRVVPHHSGGHFEHTAVVSGRRAKRYL